MNNKSDDKKIKDLIHSIGLKHNLQDEIIKKIIESPYLFTLEKLKELDLTPDVTEEEFNTLPTVFMYRCFGKLLVDYKLLRARKNRRLSIAETRKNIKKWTK